jgi:hypothetical protein
VNLHVHERGSVVIPRETGGDGFLTHRDANLPESTWRVLRDHFRLTGDRKDESARAFVGRLLRVALAVLYAPAYRLAVVVHRQDLESLRHLFRLAGWKPGQPLIPVFHRVHKSNAHQIGVSRRLTLFGSFYGRLVPFGTHWIVFHRSTRFSHTRQRVVVTTARTMRPAAGNRA